ncbi:hypothetical protein EJB05_24679, partial [Eragrostis curvula]
MSPAAKRDRLSSLPDDVLHRILRHLDARQPVGSLSLLSRRWRRVWASSPYVTLFDAGAGHSERFGNLLLLFRDRAAALHTFCLESKHVEHQRMWLREVIAPKSVHLPQLKKLHLPFEKFDPSAAEKLNSGCPTLEDMSLSKCCSLGKVQLDGMPSLVRAWVYFSDDTVKHLAGCKSIMESSAIEGLLFSKLKSLYVGEWALHDFHQPFAYFLKRAPSLATLTLDQKELTEMDTFDEIFVGKKPSNTPMLVSVLNRDLETLRIRVSEDIDDDIQEFNKMRKLSKEKTRPKET